MKKRTYKYLAAGTLIVITGYLVWLSKPISDLNQQTIREKIPSHVPKADNPDKFIV